MMHNETSPKAIWSYFLNLQDQLGGVIPVERFMQEALYHPRFGYYSTNVKTVGKLGDFSTAPTLREEFAEAVSNWIDQVRSTHPELRRVPIIELGAGSGILARKILQRQRFLTRYWIVETSKILRNEQRRRLRFRNVRWFDSPAVALQAAGGYAILFSNELVDAFSCRVFQYDKGRWLEVGLRFSDASMKEVLFDAPLPESTVFQRALESSGNIPPFCRVEVHASYRTWLEEWQPQWKGGCLLTVDYGRAASGLPTSRSNGSLRAYWKQQRYTGAEIYHRIGKQDLTADVNVEDLKNWGMQVGLEARNHYSLAAFLRRYASDKAGVSTNIRLMDTNDAGGAFFVLEQWKKKAESHATPQRRNVFERRR